MMNLHKKNLSPVATALCWVIFFGMIFFYPAVAVSAEKIKLDPSITQKVTLAVGKSTIIETDGSIKRLALASPTFADVKVLSPRQFYLIGVSPGSTNATIWGVDGKIAAMVDIEIAPDVTSLKAKIYEMLPDEKNIRVTASQDSLILAGTVSNAANLSQVLALAEAYTAKGKGGGSKIINLLEVGGVHQVMLEVRVAEMSRTLMRKLGVNLRANYFDDGNSFSVGFLKDLTPSIISNVPVGILDGIFRTGAVNWIVYIDALKENGLTKILAEPTLITTSGRTANFLAGGEYPIPVPQTGATGGGSVITIEYRTYGVGLNFTPTVLSNSKISMEVAPEVSQLDESNSITVGDYVVPGLTTRRVSTVVELADGQTFAIAGLLKDDVREAVSKFPVLGDIPVLGTLFRSTSFQKSETELVIIVTPHLVKPVDMAKQTLPTDQYVEPNDFEFYLLGKMEGSGEPVSGSTKRTVPASSNAGGLEGDFGHIAP